METSTSNIATSLFPVDSLVLPKTMVLTRTAGQLSTAGNNKGNTSGMITFETKGSVSFDARDKKLGHKYAHKSRNHGRDEFTMLQRPTPIILAKPTVREEETSPAGASQRQIDEASKDFTKLHQHQNVDQRVLPPLQTLLTNTNLQKPLNYGALEQSESYCQEPKQHDGLKSLSGHKFTEANKPVQALAVTKEASVVVESLVSRLTTASRFMESSVPLLDEGLGWKESLGEFLLDQADFLVVGVLGKRGVGKSTLMSMIGGARFNATPPLFKPTQASGVHAFVTSERTILLDVQPLLSSSLLDRSLAADKKHPPSDFKYQENFIEMQSIELACLTLSICHVVIVAEDFFIDPNLFRLIQTAEMLMPSGLQAGELEPQWDQKYPHLVYVLNKCETLNRSDTRQMKLCIDHLLRGSKLVYKNSLTEMIGGSGLMRSGKKRAVRSKSDSDSVNFVPLPKVQQTQTKPSKKLQSWQNKPF